MIQENAKAAGVTVKINKMGIAAYLANWMKWPVSMDVGGNTYLFDVGNSLLKDAGGNIAHWNDPEFQSLSNELFHSADTTSSWKSCSRWRRSTGSGRYLISAWSNRYRPPGRRQRAGPGGLQPAGVYLQDVGRVKGGEGEAHGGDSSGEDLEEGVIRARSLLACGPTPTGDLFESAPRPRRRSADREAGGHGRRQAERKAGCSSQTDQPRREDLAAPSVSSAATARRAHGIWPLALSIARAPSRPASLPRVGRMP